MRDGYNPDLTNIMSYYRPRNHFTDGQGWRMRQAILNNTLLQPLLNGSCSISSIDWEYDNNAPTCINQTKTFSLTNIPTSTTVNWSVTNNLTITNSNSNSVTIRLNNFDEEAIITGTLVINLLGSIAEFELDRIAERRAEGIAQAKKKGTYLGRSKGSAESREQFLNKPKVQAVIRELKKSNSVRVSAKMSGASVGLVQKVKRELEAIQ